MQNDEKNLVTLFFFLLILSNSFITKATEQNINSDHLLFDDYKRNSVELSKRLVITELGYSKSKSLKEKRQNCTPGGINGLSIIELAILILGVNSDDSAPQTLVN